MDRMQGGERSNGEQHRPPGFGVENGSFSQLQSSMLWKGAQGCGLRDRNSRRYRGRFLE